jgi:hypothetical protein
VDELRVEFERDGNPVYVFAAISWLASEARAAAPTARDAAVALPSSLPPWIMRYLIDIARDVQRLAQGRNPFTMPVDQDPRSDHGEEAWRKWTSEGLEPATALRMLPAVMGFARPGKNAFNEARSLRIKKLIAWFFDLKRGEGETFDAAAGSVAESFGYENARSVQRIAAEVQARRQGGKTEP